MAYYMLELRMVLGVNDWEAVAINSVLGSSASAEALLAEWDRAGATAAGPVRQ